MFLKEKIKSILDLGWTGNTILSSKWEDLIESSGVDRKQINRLANVVSQSKGMITCWAMGITQTENAVATIREIVNLHLLGGHIGKKGAGLCPVRGHSNVQGDRTMGFGRECLSHSTNL